MHDEDFEHDCIPSIHCQQIHGFYCSREEDHSTSHLYTLTCSTVRRSLSFERGPADGKKRERGILRCVWWIHSLQWWMEWRLQQIQSKSPSQACKVTAHTHHFVHSLLLLAMLKLHQKPHSIQSNKEITIPDKIPTQCKTEWELRYLLVIKNGRGQV